MCGIRLKRKFVADRTITSSPTSMRGIESHNVHLITALLMGLAALELIFLLLFRNVNLDEGWYLWASKLVYEGRVLYRDFAYTQTPLLPYIYGAFQRLAGEGLIQGRVLTVLFSCCTLWICTRIAQRMAGSSGGFFCLLLAITSTYALAYLSYTATYGLATLFIASALYVAAGASSLRWSEGARGSLSLLLLCLAVATRMSTIAALPPLFLYLLLSSNRPKRTALWGGLTTLVSLCFVFLPLNVVSEGLMRYDIFGFHTDRILRLEWQLEKIFRILRETLLIFAVPLLLSTWSTFSAIVTRRNESAWPRPAQAGPLLELTLLSMVVGMALLHFIPRTTSSFYHTLEAPLLWILGGVGLQRLWVRPQKGILHALWPGSARVSKGITALITVLIVVNGVLQTRAVVQNDLVHVSKRPQLLVVQEAARFLETIDRQNNRLLTFSTHLALEANMMVPLGYEMSVFSYRPTWDEEKARHYKAVNNEILIQDLLSRADAVAVTDWDFERFYGERDRIFASLEENYRWSKTIPGFDPFHNPLRIYLPPQFTSDENQNPSGPVARLADGIELIKLDLDRHHYQPGETVSLGVYWRAAEVPRIAYTGFVHILDAEGQLVVGWDNPPCHRTCPTTSWQRGEYLRDEYLLELPRDLKPGPYTIQVGMYNSETGAPLAIEESAVPLVEQRLQLASIRISS